MPLRQFLVPTFLNYKTTQFSVMQILSNEPYYLWLSSLRRPYPETFKNKFRLRQKLRKITSAMFIEIKKY